MPDIVHELRGLAIGMASPSLGRDTVSRAADEIERLRKELDGYREAFAAERETRQNVEAELDTLRNKD